MSTVKQLSQHNLFSIFGEIQNHPAWIGRVSGQTAYHLMKGRKIPFLYVLREGEFEGDYYVTFVRPDFSVHHVSFDITVTEAGWSYTNHNPGGPYTEASIDDVIHLIMGCPKDACSPLSVEL